MISAVSGRWHEPYVFGECSLALEPARLRHFRENGHRRELSDAWNGHQMHEVDELCSIVRKISK